MCTENELKFSIFLIHNLADRWDKLPSEVYTILNDTQILDDYIIRCYDTLHTLGRNYLIEDITEFVMEKGIQL